MKCPKCNRKIENSKISHALHLRVANTFDTEMENIKKYDMLRLRVLSAGTHDAEMEDQSVSAICHIVGIYIKIVDYISWTTMIIENII